MWRDEALLSKFVAVTELLQSNQSWWRPRAFFEKQLSWESEHPELSAALRQMPLNQSEQLAADEQSLADFLVRWIPVAKALTDLCLIPQARIISSRARSDHSHSEHKRREPAGVPGRKWQQIQAFVDHLETTDMPALEWCAGKAHLGRWYARHNAACVDALEWNGELVAAGNQLARREQVPVQIHHIDVMSPAAQNYLSDQLHGKRQVLALHACGQLHIHLLQLCAAAPGAAAIALAPCCYQLIPQDSYQPLSAMAHTLNLPLTKLDLHTAVQESVTSPERVLKQRRQLQAWRLGFDLLQREARGVDEYLHTPSQPLSVLAAGFQTFCERMALEKNIKLPVGVNFADYEQQGAMRFVAVNALDLPRVLFRRALEVWLVLDRAVYLQESGYRVSIGTFCERALTPRNILIQALRH